MVHGHGTNGEDRRRWDVAPAAECLGARRPRWYFLPPLAPFLSEMPPSSSPPFLPTRYGSDSNSTFSMKGSLQPPLHRAFAILPLPHRWPCMAWGPGLVQGGQEASRLAGSPSATERPTLGSRLHAVGPSGATSHRLGVGDRALRGQEPLCPPNMTQWQVPPPSESDNAHFPPKRPL